MYRYKDSCWTSGLSPKDCFALLQINLNISYSEFLVYRILARLGGCTWTEIYKHALKLLEGVLKISKHRDRINSFAGDFSWSFIFYGLPSAALLAIQLLREHQQADSPSSGLSRAETIRRICVFTSCLEWAAPPDDGNYDLCQRARRMLEIILDAILDDSKSTPAAGFQDVPSDPVMWVDEMFSNGWMASGPFVDSLGIEYTGPDGWDLPSNWTFEF